MSDDAVLPLIDNVNRKYVIGKQEYLLLVKHQKEKDYSTLYITDCQSTFWLKKIDRLFLDKLKTDLSIKTDITTFTTHLAQALADNSNLKVTHEGIEVQIQLMIGEGLIMKCSFIAQNIISLDQDSQDFRMILKIFFRQLYEAKESEIMKERQKCLQLSKDKEMRLGKRDVDPNYVKEVLQGNSKKMTPQIKIPKNRNLMNPNQKKRKNIGAKLGSGYEEVQAKQQNID